MHNINPNLFTSTYECWPCAFTLTVLPSVTNCASLFIRLFHCSRQQWSKWLLWCIGTSLEWLLDRKRMKIVLYWYKIGTSNSSIDPNAQHVVAYGRTSISSGISDADVVDKYSDDLVLRIWRYEHKWIVKMMHIEPLTMVHWHWSIWYNMRCRCLPVGTILYGFLACLQFIRMLRL
jgi:hypothetical protein